MENQNAIIEVTAQEVVEPEAKVIGTLAIRNVDDLSRIAKMCANSGYFQDAQTATQAGVKILTGMELGITPIASMTGIHVINGKPVISAGLMAGIIKRSPVYDYRLKKLTNTECFIEFLELLPQKESLGFSNFTIDDAKQSGALSGKNAHTWTKYPRNMLFARAISNGIKWFCPDLFITPVYTADELGNATDEEGNIIK
jgi:hypothetical protein